MKSFEYLLTLACIGVPVSSLAMTCTPSTTTICDNGECTSIRHAEPSRVLVQGDSISRCFKASCDDYKTVTAQSGIFKIYSIPKSGYFLKIDDELNFTEVASLGLRVLIKSGKCGLD